MAECNENDLVDIVTSELKITLSQVAMDPVMQAVEVISNTQKIFLAGAGRSALGVRGFAMRLMHLGKTAYVVGETTTPGITKDDLLIIGSGSGRSGSLVTMSDKAKNIGAKIILVTIDPTSPIGEISDYIIQIPAPTPKSDKAKGKSIQPMGSLFEQSLFILLDIIVLLLMRKTGLASDDMFKRHANME